MNIQFLVVDRREVLLRFLSGEGVEASKLRQSLWSNISTYSDVMAQVFEEFWSRGVRASVRFEELRALRVFKETLKMLKTTVDAKRWEFQAPGRVKGKSGAFHEFGFLMRMKEKPEVFFVADFSVKEGATQILKLHAKAFDVDPTARFLLVCKPGLRKGEVDLARLYGIEVIEGIDAKELTSQIVGRLKLVS